MIGFKCSQCGKNLRVSDDAAGKQGKCPQCGATLKVPQQELMTLEAAAPNPTPATASGGECARDRYGCARTTPPALEAESDKHLPIRWLNFYVDIIPVGIVLSVVLVVYALAHGLYSDDPTSVPFILNLYGLEGVPWRIPFCRTPSTAPLGMEAQLVCLGSGGSTGAAGQG